jgi:hypothetical protein
MIWNNTDRKFLCQKELYWTEYSESIKICQFNYKKNIHLDLKSQEISSDILVLRELSMRSAPFWVITLRDSPEDHGSHLLRGGSLQSRTESCIDFCVHEGISIDRRL